MEASSLLKILGQIAGIGGLALGVLLLVYGQLLRKEIFPTLTRKSSYLLLRQIVGATFGISALGIGAWTATSLFARSDEPISVETTEFMGGIQIVQGSVILQQFNELNGEAPDAETRALVEQATRLVSEGLYAEAVGVYRLLAARTEIPAVQANLGAMLALTGQLDEARGALSRAVTSGGDASAARVNLALVEIREGQAAPALATLLEGEQTPETRRLVSLIAEERESGAIESEPNQDLDQANVLRPGQPVRGAVSAEDASDAFALTLPEGPLDWFDVSVGGVSPDLQADVFVYAANREQVANGSASTPGQDVALSFVGRGGERYYVRMAPLYGTAGAYQLAVHAREARDGFEPNDSILQPSRVEGSRTVEANLHHSGDFDYFQFLAGADEARISVRLANGSAALAPHVAIYDRLKRRLAERWASTAGEDIVLEAEIPPGEPFYVVVSPYFYSATLTGAALYTLTVER